MLRILFIILGLISVSGFLNLNLQSHGKGTLCHASQMEHEQKCTNLNLVSRSEETESKGKSYWVNRTDLLRANNSNLKLLKSMMKKMVFVFFFSVFLNGEIPSSMALMDTATILSANENIEIVDELSAPTQEEIEKQRIAAKLKRQQEDASKKGYEETSGQRTFKKGLEMEREKQKKANKKDKKQRREDLCETLGRGC